jgi:hypothetical protein
MKPQNWPKQAALTAESKKMRNMRDIAFNDHLALF